MKKAALYLIILFISITGLFAQELCVGNYWTEAQGKAHLDSVRAVVQTRAQWERRAERIREQILTGAGLQDLPSKRGVPQVKTGATHEMKGYRVTNMAIESTPGSWVTGNLYEPTGLKGPFAGILCPHGHWSDPNDYGRFRPDMQKRCAVLCQMGAVVFAYDMVGYGDNRQAPSHDDPMALHIQTLNSIRLIDYLTGRSDIDPKRIGVTGASGGGTQSFLITAVDSRVAVSVPCVQVSAHFFGGCVCESGMPIHRSGTFQASNPEIAALAAPRPMLLISDGADWTRNTPLVEYPFIQYIYGLCKKENRMENAHFADEKHDYGFNKRQAAYAFLAKHLNLNADPAITSESQIQILPYNTLSLSTR
jgi:dienelactone hydrolase